MKKSKFLFCLSLSGVLCTYSIQAQTAVRQDLETFIRTFDRNYPFFPEKAIDWPTQKQTLRETITSNSTRQELVDQLCETITLLEDGHTTIWQEDSLLCYSPTPSQFLEEFRGRYREFGQNTYRTLYQNGFDSIQHTDPIGVYFYTRMEGIAYIRIRKFSVYPNHYKNIFTERRDRRALEQKIDSLLTIFADTRGLILDVRSNPGGDYGRIIAGRFVAEEKVSALVACRKNGGDYDEFTRMRSERVRPRGHRYTNPIVVLANDQTASSAEEFVLALKNEAHITILGTNTSGSLSDAIGQRLSNGLRFEYSTQRYYSPDVIMLEDRGIQPDIYMENTQQDLEQGSDPLIEKAIELLNRQE